MSRRDLYHACWTYVHDLSFDEAMKTADPLIRSLVVLDQRLGKGRLPRMAAEKLRPLAKRLLALRRESESQQTGVRDRAVAERFQR